MINFTVPTCHYRHTPVQMNLIQAICVWKHISVWLTINSGRIIVEQLVHISPRILFNTKFMPVRTTGVVNQPPTISCFMLGIISNVLSTLLHHCFTVKDCRRVPRRNKKCFCAARSTYYAVVHILGKGAGLTPPSVTDWAGSFTLTQPWQIKLLQFSKVLQR